MLKPSPWDTAALGMPAWELSEYSPAALRVADGTPGHQTIRVDPLADKRLLQEHGFYYCDTLLATRCTPQRLAALDIPPEVHVSRDIDTSAALAICHGAFAHGRFHRDFAIDRHAADIRYDNWLRQLLDAGHVYGLYRRNEGDGDQLAGFIGYSGAALVLHAVAPALRGHGLAKYWWHLVVGELFAAGHDSVGSSISASNMAVLNLYASLGFSLANPQDIYHRVIP
jgi:ribosomal protein S18 acetylase RimI-like enzyme